MTNINIYIFFKKINIFSNYQREECRNSRVVWDWGKSSYAFYKCNKRFKNCFKIYFEFLKIVCVYVCTYVYAITHT